ncbi:hypothetical protein L207DRAFT_571648 [Hyaloscypha variabilis F]|uniref:DUF3237 domain-containing protein n=1 Tax=Hyaloscypha variabilis (strain UAMH 11265 / GT02V1 / F) TaxID=1149755 RepID=A0A2J6R4T5_HYAVF|nr:hypothetical protein L207DRAFT_571648 [Hyaloscypha variabilis F]
MASPRLTHVFNLAAYSLPVAFPTEVNTVCNLYAAGVEGGTFSTADGKTSFDVLNASDWMTMEASGTGVAVDARVNAQGANGGLDLQYQGKLKFSAEMMEMMQGKRSGTEFGEGYYYVSPKISSRMEEFKWVNETVFLGQGRIRMRPDGKLEVSYRIYKVD